MARAAINQIDGDEPWERVVVPATAFLLVLVGGTIAYRILGLSWLDAFYQTLITVSTVGYGEVGTEVTPAYRAVSSVVILVGVGVGVYSIGVFFEALMEGRLSDQVGRRRVRREIDALSGHVIVCGWGQVGRAIARDLVEAGESVVIIDRRAEVIDNTEDALAIVGEATDDESLLAAGISRARSLVVALDGESDNLFVTLSGRALNPELFIVTRAVGPTSGAKLKQAGADRVVNPHEIGALRMASFVLEPNVADFLGETMTDRRLQVRLGEIEVIEGGPLADRTFAESGFLAATRLTVLAIRHANGSFVHRPAETVTTVVGDVLIVLGTPEQHYAGRAWLADGA